MHPSKCPGPRAKLPTPHEGHEACPTDADHRPAAHSTHSVSPLWLYLPATQLMQLVCWAKGWYWPASQLSQRALPVVAAKVPEGHSMHAPSDAASWYWPAGQLSHASSVSGRSVYCPGGQSRQIRSAVPVFPEGHRTQASTELNTAVPLRNVVRPPGQREHWLPAAETSSYWPISQSWQPVAEFCPLPPVCCDPAPHSIHALAPSGEAGTYVPTGQYVQDVFVPASAENLSCEGARQTTHGREQTRWMGTHCPPSQTLQDSWPDASWYLPAGQAGQLAASSAALA